MSLQDAASLPIFAVIKASFVRVQPKSASLTRKLSSSKRFKLGRELEWDGEIPLEISVENRRIEAMEVVHRLCGVQCKSLAIIPGQVDLEIL
jgi:hypothetical protein